MKHKEKLEYARQYGTISAKEWRKEGRRPCGEEWIFIKIMLLFTMHQ